MDAVKTSLPSEITVQAIPGGMAYRLPWRDVPAALWRTIGQFIAVGIVGLAIAMGLFCFMFGGGKDSFFFGLGVMALVFGLLAIGGAVCVVYTRTALETDGNEVRLQEWYGPFKSELKRPLPMIRKVVVHHLVIGKPREGERFTPDTPLDEAGEPKYGALEIICEGAQNLFTAHTYPRPWLLALGAELASRLHVPHEVAPLDGDVKPIIPFFSLTRMLEDRDTFDEPNPPPDNAWQAHTDGGILTLTLPAMGFVREGNWFGMLISGLFLMLGLWHLADAIPNVVQAPTSLLFGLVLLGVSGVSLLFLWRRAKTVITLLVSEDRLRYYREGPLGANKHEEWPRAEIAAIRVGIPKTSQKGVDRKAVYLHLVGGKEHWLVETSRVQEMRWLATILRKTLGVPAVAAVRPPSHVEEAIASHSPQ